MPSTTSSLAPRWPFALTAIRRRDAGTSRTTDTRGAKVWWRQRGNLLTLGSVRRPAEGLLGARVPFASVVPHEQLRSEHTLEIRSHGPLALAWCDGLARLDLHHAIRVDIVLDVDPSQRAAALTAIDALSRRALAVRAVLTPALARRLRRRGPLLDGLVESVAVHGADDITVGTEGTWYFGRPRGPRSHARASFDARLASLRARHGLPRRVPGRG